MPLETGIITAIDVGTTKVQTIVARKEGATGLHVLSHSVVPCLGLRKGNVTDIAATEKAVRESVQRVEGETGLQIDSAFVGVTGSHVSFENRKDRLATAGRNGVITSAELNRTPAQMSASFNEPGRKVIHAIRKSYSVDGEEGIRNPLGMHSQDVEVETHLVTGGAPYVNRLVQAVEKTGISITSLVLEPLASGLAVLTPAEKERGAVLVDVGGGTTDVVVFRQGRIFYSGVIPIGGYQFTNDIAITFNTTYEAAEAAKLKYGTTESAIKDSAEEISLPAVGRDVGLKVKRVEISQLTRERALELGRLISLKLEDAQIEESWDLRLVLTGGGSNLPGLPGLIQRSLSIPARHGVPSVQGELAAEFRNPAYATGVGILVWAVNEYVPEISSEHANGHHNIEARPNGLFTGLLGLLGRLVSSVRFGS